MKRNTPLRAKSWCRRCGKSLCGCGSTLDRTTRLNPVNRPRRKAERLRAYGPPERREAVRAMQCAVPGCSDRSENAHLVTGGTGRKADADTVANLCAGHHRLGSDSLHRLGSVARFDDVHGTDLWACAEAIEAMYPTREE